MDFFCVNFFMVIQEDCSLIVIRQVGHEFRVVIDDAPDFRIDLREYLCFPFVAIDMEDICWAHDDGCFGEAVSREPFHGSTSNTLWAHCDVGGYWDYIFQLIDDMIGILDEREKLLEFVGMSRIFHPGKRFGSLPIRDLARIPVFLDDFGNGKILRIPECFVEYFRPMIAGC